MTMMVRIMSLLPFATGSLCLLLVLVSFFGFASGTIDDEIPALPCVGAQDECVTGMSESNLDVPSAFFLLDVQLDISMELEDEAWIGIVDAKYADSCPPGDTGLTNCTASDYVFLAGGPDHDGAIEHDLQPGSVRFVTGGDEGAIELQDNAISTDWSVHLATWVEAILVLVGIGLCASGMHMAFPMVAGMRKD